MIYAHEHITIDLAGAKGDPDCRLDDRDAALEEFRGLARRGVAWIVDQTNRGMGRNIPYAKELARKAGLRVLFGAGWYKEPFLPDECYALDQNEMRELMLRELRQGIENTSVCASFIGEIGTSADCIHPVEEKIFRAAAQAQLESGCPLCTHTTLGKLGMEQLALFKEYGIDFSRIVLSHIDLSGDLDYMLRLLDTGVNIGFDTIGKADYQSDDDRVLWLTALCDRGYAGQIVLSVDITRKSYYQCKGGPGYAHLPDHFLPKLRAAGCRAEDIEKMMNRNPRRIYGIPNDN
ncbi:MAG: phosphotriesterase-related protein [Fusobacteriaceae bacterium]|jgi:phosphotriesterase-related protein|nr:phosphotriesterase-related protein [Fusobacteriaceae bacterium]